MRFTSHDSSHNVLLDCYMKWVEQCPVFRAWVKLLRVHYQVFRKLDLSWKCRVHLLDHHSQVTASSSAPFRRFPNFYWIAAHTSHTAGLAFWLATAVKCFSMDFRTFTGLRLTLLTQRV